MKISNSFKNNRGGSFLILILIICAVMVEAFYVSSTLTTATVEKRESVRESLAALEVLQDQSVMIKQAYDTYKSAQASGSECPTGTETLSLTGFKICIPTSSVAKCSKDPRFIGSTSSASGGANNGGGSGGSNSGTNNRVTLVCPVTIAKNQDAWPGSKNDFGSWSATVKVEKLNWPIFAQEPIFREENDKTDWPFQEPVRIRNHGSLFETEAMASQLDLPPAAALGALSNSLQPLVCPSADPRCMICSGGPGASEMQCVSISVCMKSTCAVSQLYTQVFGFTN